MLNSPVTIDVTFIRIALLPASSSFLYLAAIDFSYLLEASLYPFLSLSLLSLRTLRHGARKARPGGA